MLTLDMIHAVHRTDAKRLLLGLTFTAALVTSASLGLASQRIADARFMEGDGASGTTSTQIIGNAPASTQVFGEAPGGVASFGEAPPPVQTMGTAPGGKSAKKAESKTSTGPKKQPTAPVVTTAPNQPTAAVASAVVSSPDKSAKQEVKTEQTEEAEAKAEVDTAILPSQQVLVTTAVATSSNEATVIAAATTLPTTGPGQVAGLFTGTSIFGFLAHKMYLRRKQ